MGGGVEVIGALRTVFLRLMGYLGQPGTIVMRRCALVARDKKSIQHRHDRELNPGPRGWQPSVYH